MLVINHPLSLILLRPRPRHSNSLPLLRCARIMASLDYQQLNKPLPQPPRIELIEEIGVYVDLPDPVREDFVELPQLPPIGYVLNDIYVLVQNSEIINKYIESQLRPVRALRLFMR